MAVNILLVEDEFSIAMDLKMRLKKMGYDVAGIALDYEDALQKITLLKPDLILMDIHLGKDADGIDIAQTVYKNFQIPVVFVTAFSDKATIERAMKAMPFGYLIKPFRDVDVDNAVTLAMQQYKELHERNVALEFLKQQGSAASTIHASQHIYIRNKGQLEKIMVEDILLLEALDNYTVVHAGSQKYTVPGLLKDLHNQLPDDRFLRIHKSYVVNTAAIKAIDDNVLILSNSLSVPVGKSHRTGFFARIKVLH